jgi:hypothetical protein
VLAGVEPKNKFLSAIFIVKNFIVKEWLKSPAASFHPCFKSGFGTAHIMI